MPSVDEDAEDAGNASIADEEEANSLLDSSSGCSDSGRAHDAFSRFRRDIDLTIVIYGFRSPTWRIIRLPYVLREPRIAIGGCRKNSFFRARVGWVPTAHGRPNEVRCVHLLRYSRREAADVPLGRVLGIRQEKKHASSRAH